ncbi:CapA family protein [Pseudomonas sp. CVAP|uniref:CapA family protein n=1 Tax=Pseudomonas sp. CVAP\|nr:CapA family protein [Pseudomonas sp. CVAP\
MKYVIYGSGIIFFSSLIHDFLSTEKTKTFYTDVFVSLCAFTVTLFLAEWLNTNALFYEERLSLKLPFVSTLAVPTQFLIALIIQDLLYYWMHRCEHTYALLWVSHYTHHSSPFFNAFISLRSSLFQFLYFPLFMSPLLLLGFPSEILLSALLFGKVYSLFTHSKYPFTLGSTLERLLVSPNNHKLHHASNPEYIDKNFGGVFIVWDLIFGTYAQPANKPKTINYGIANSSKYSFLSGLFGGFTQLYRKTKAASGIKNKIETVLHTQNKNAPGSYPAKPGHFFERAYRFIHYEDQAWSLWKIHYNIAYIAKSYFLCPTPEKPNDKLHFLASSRYLEEQKFSQNKNISHLSDSCITLTFVGDIMWVPKHESSYIDQKIISFALDTDLTVLNMETPISSKHPIPKRTYDSFNASENLLTPWTNFLGKKVFSLCNNHALDCGVPGLHETRKIIEAHADSYALGGPKEGDEILTIEVNDIKIGLFGLTYGFNKHRKSAPPIGIPTFNFTDNNREIDWSAISTYINNLKNQGCELIILAAHWGYEYEYWPTETQRKNAYRLIELGADIIMGTSPHVVQPMELVSIDGFDSKCPIQVNRGGPARQAIIFYSLGNALSCMSAQACKEGIIPKVSFSKSSAGAGTPLQLTTLQLLATTTVIKNKLYRIEPINRSRHSFWFPFFRNLIPQR